MKSGPTIQDIAASAGVSKSTVSLVLQESPRIKAETAEKVREAARSLGYVYNRGAAALRGRRSTTIGMVINDLTNPFFVELLVAIERVLAQAGYTTLMAHTAESVATQTRVLRSMREQNVAGLIMSPALGTDDQLPREIQSWGIPLVLVMRPMGVDVDTVGVDNGYGFALATEHLIGEGHTRIAFAGHRKGYAVAKQRREGFMSADHRRRTDARRRSSGGARDLRDEAPADSGRLLQRSGGDRRAARTRQDGQTRGQGAGGGRLRQRGGGRAHESASHDAVRRRRQTRLDGERDAVGAAERIRRR
jgi:DNA-binding LacI/PurR family transcriptional regulator